MVLKRHISLHRKLLFASDPNHNVRIMNHIYTATIQSTQECEAVTFGFMAPSKLYTLQGSQNQGMRLILGVPRGTSAKRMRHELQILPMKHRAKLYMKIR